MPYTDDPAGTPTDEVRFLVGDTTSPYDLTDNEVVYLLGLENGNANRAAARAAETLAAKYTKAYEEKRVGPLLLRSYSDKAGRFSKLAKALWSRASATTVVPFAGGISVTDKANREADTDVVQPTFKRTMMDYPGGSGDTASDEELRP